MDQRRGASQLRNLILSSKKPVFVEHNYFALPWNSGQNPTEILAGETTRVTSLTKLSWFPLRFPTIEYGPGLEDRIKGYIRTQYYAEAFVFKENKWCHLLEESGYRKFSFHGNLVRYIR